jgi:hypothetical protein
MYWCPNEAKALDKAWDEVKEWTADIAKTIEEFFALVVDGAVVVETSIRMFLSRGAEAQKEFFPAAYSSPDFTRNDFLLGYARLALGYVVEGYKPQELGANNEQMQMPVTSSVLEHTDLLPGWGRYLDAEPETYCRSKDSHFPVDYTATWARSSHASQGATSSSFNAQIFHYKRRLEHLIILNIRGSQTPVLGPKLFDPANLVQTFNTLKHVWGDWFGTDLAMVSERDQICNNDVELQIGYARAWLANREATLAALDDEIKKYVHSHKPVRVLITGHSLGAAIAELIAYDVNCNNFFDKYKGTRVINLGVITFGTPSFVFKGQKGRDKYTETVPASSRLQIEACHETSDSVFGSWISCDPVGFRLKGLDYEPVDVGQVQTVMRDGRSITPDCYGFPNGVLCHLLDAYLEGIRKNHKMNHICQGPSTYWFPPAPPSPSGQPSPGPQPPPAGQSPSAQPTDQPMAAPTSPWGSWGSPSPRATPRPTSSQRRRRRRRGSYVSPRRRRSWTRS